MLTLLGLALPFLGLLWKYKNLALVGVLIAAGGYLYYIGDKHGRAVISARWVAAERAMLEKGEKARDEAEQKYPDLTPEEAALDDVNHPPAPSIRPCRVPDKFDRDCN